MSESVCLRVSMLYKNGPQPCRLYIYGYFPISYLPGSLSTQELAADIASFGQPFAPPFDLVYLDADKRAYERYYDLLLDTHMLSVGGLLVADNVLFRGRVYTHKGVDEDSGDKLERRYNEIGRSLDKFNKRVAADPRVQQVLLPIADGVSIVRRIK